MKKEQLPAVTNKKMTLEEYQQESRRNLYSPLVKPTIILLAATLGVVIVSMLVLVVSKMFERNEYLGYVSIGLAVLILILFYIIPLVQIHRLKPFIINVDRDNIRKAQRYNKQLREKIADHFIDITAKTEGLGWYSKELVGDLAIARNTKDNEMLKNTLTRLYLGDVKRQATEMIKKTAIRVGVLTAISQSEKIDTLVVGTFNYKLVKDIIYLYGFRPTDNKLLKIYASVVSNALLAYGVSISSNSFGVGVSKGITAVAEGLPWLGNAIAVAIGSATEGVINAIMCAVIGNQTVKYLKEEYHLQDMLDGVEVPDLDEDKIVQEVKTEVIAEAKAVKKSAKAANN